MSGGGGGGGALPPIFSRTISGHHLHYWVGVPSVHNTDLRGDKQKKKKQQQQQQQQQQLKFRGDYPPNLKFRGTHVPPRPPPPPLPPPMWLGYYKSAQINMHLHFIGPLSILIQNGLYKITVDPILGGAPGAPHGSATECSPHKYVSLFYLRPPFHRTETLERPLKDRKLARSFSSLQDQ